MKLFNVFRKETGPSFWVGPIMGCLTLLVFCAYSHAEADDSTSDGRTQTVRKIFEETIVARQGGYSGFVDKVIATLHKESLDESLKGLDDITRYQFPGDRAAGGSIPIDIIPKIVGNRRFLKVFGELSMMPKDEAAALLYREIQTALKQYNNAFYEYIEELDIEQRLAEKPERKTFGLALYIPGQEPTLVALRYKMLALTLLAGNLELDLADSGMNLILETALEQKVFLQDRELFTAADGNFLIREISLYDPAFLGLALVQGSGKSSYEKESILNSLNLSMEALEMVPYDAKVTPMDQAMDFTWPVDYSKGKFEIEYFPFRSIDTSKFNSLREAVGAGLH